MIGDENGSYAEQMFQEEVRVEKMLWLPGILPEHPSEDFEQFCEDLPTKAENPLYAALPWLKPFAYSGNEDDDEGLALRVAEALCFRNVRGFLVKFATPVMKPFGADFKGREYSWGYYSMRWVHCKDEADIGRQALAYAAEMRAEEIKRAKSKAA